MRCHGCGCFCPNRLNQGSLCNPGTTVTEGEERKIEYRELIDNGYIFQPVAMEVQGSLGESSEIFITRLCKMLLFVRRATSWQLFRSRKKFSTTYAIVLFFLFFFSPDLFMKISNFSKTVHSIFTKFCTVILHPKGPLRVQRHQNRMTGM